MALTNDQILALPIRAFERSTKRILFELVDGKQFYLLGGQDDRPKREKTAYFSPREMLMIVVNGLDEDTFRKLILMKEMGLAGEVCEITAPTAQA